MKHTNNFAFLSLLLLSFVCSSAFGRPNEIFVVKSLNQTEDSTITLTISIDALGNATVSKQISLAQPEDKVTIYVIGNNVTFDAGGIDTMELEIQDQIPDQFIFWVDIELHSNPSIPSGGSELTFYCLSYNCPTEERCKPVGVISNNKANVECNKPCGRCLLRSKTSTGVQMDQGGVFICAKAVTYI